MGIPLQSCGMANKGMTDEEWRQAARDNPGQAIHRDWRPTSTGERWVPRPQAKLWQLTWAHLERARQREARRLLDL